MKNFYVDNKEQRIVLILLLPLSLALRGVWFSLTNNIHNSTDILDRDLIAWKLFENPLLSPKIDWQFGHFWMLNFFMRIFNNTEFAPRLVGLISGFLITLPLYFLGKRLFGPMSAIIACIIYSASPPQIVLSGPTLTTIPFSFFILGGIYYFVKYQGEYNKNDQHYFYVCKYYSI